MKWKLFLAVMVVSVSAMAQSITADPSTSAAWPAGTTFDHETSATTDPLGPFSGAPILFKGWNAGGSQVSINGQPCSNNNSCPVFDYHATFPSTIAITSLSFTGDAFNDATFQLLDSNNTVIHSLSVNSGNVGHPVTYTMPAPGAVGENFTLKLFDNSTTWTFVSNIAGAAANDVTPQVNISLAPFTANRNSRDPMWCTVITLSNSNLYPDRGSRGSEIAGPIEIVLNHLSSNATLRNPSGTLLGAPYVIVQPSALPSGGQASAQLCFTNPTGGPVAFHAQVFSGALL